MYILDMYYFYIIFIEKIKIFIVLKLKNIWVYTIGTRIANEFGIMHGLRRGKVANVK